MEYEIAKGLFRPASNGRYVNFEVPFFPTRATLRKRGVYLIEGRNTPFFVPVVHSRTAMLGTSPGRLIARLARLEANYNQIARTDELNRTHALPP